MFEPSMTSPLALLTSQLMVALRPAGGALAAAAAAIRAVVPRLHRPHRPAPPWLARLVVGCPSGRAHALNSSPQAAGRRRCDRRCGRRPPFAGAARCGCLPSTAEHAGNGAIRARRRRSECGPDITNAVWSPERMLKWTMDGGLLETRCAGFLSRRIADNADSYSRPKRITKLWT